MKRKKDTQTRRLRKNKPTAYFRDGEVVGEIVVTSEDGTEKEVYRTVMVLCPEPQLREIEVLSDFNYIDRSDFVAAATQQLLDYLDARKPEEEPDSQPAPPADELNPDDILMSRERYPYEDDEDLGTLWAAEDDGEE